MLKLLLLAVVNRKGKRGGEADDKLCKTYGQIIHIIELVHIKIPKFIHETEMAVSGKF